MRASSRFVLSAVTLSVLFLTSPLLAQGTAKKDAVNVPAVDSSLRERLLADAEHAWSFFTRKTGGFAGMSSVNIWREGKSYGTYDIATMWDTGSIILATLSARSIGLIDQAEFETRIEGILKFLDKATTTDKGAPLPNFRSNPFNGRSVERGYDATDTGRLFVALHVLEGATNGKYKAEALMKKWNVAATISDGAMQDIKGGAMSPAQSNIYRYYVSRGYELWKVPHAPVYGGPSPDRDAAAKAQFLAELGSIGPISSEPSLNEIIELGPSPYASVIAETLGKAQKARYEATGKLTAVSEGPVDKEPWFTYQGYDITRDGEHAWTVYPWQTDKKWATPEFAEDYRVISSKAAFLWFAAAPDDYTQKLWEAVRETARAPKFGFHPGVYEKSGAAPQNIDVNTNAMILSAIAYIFNGRQPLISTHVGS